MTHVAFRCFPQTPSEEIKFVKLSSEQFLKSELEKNSILFYFRIITAYIINTTNVKET